jgi:hypothetical protein
MQFHTDFQYDPAQDRRADTDIGITISKFLWYKLVLIYILASELITTFTYSNSIYTEFCVEFMVEFAYCTT